MCILINLRIRNDTDLNISVHIYMKFKFKERFDLMNSDVINEILKFRDERNWKQFHNPKDLAISISLEAAELLENFQWSSWEEAVKTKKANIAEELADVLIYCILMADAVNLDIEKIISEKISKNEGKYPVQKSFGKKDKYTEF